MINIIASVILCSFCVWSPHQSHRNNVSYNTQCGTDSIDHQWRTILPLSKCMDWSDFLLLGSDEKIEWPMIPETAGCSLCYTSGTTGKPKVWSEINILWDFHNLLMNELSWSRDIRICMNECFVYVYGKNKHQ